MQLADVKHPSEFGKRVKLKHLIPRRWVVIYCFVENPSSQPLKVRKYVMKIDFKSALFGLVIAGAAFLAIAAGETEGKSGKYQATTASGFVIILDTETGQAWGANLAAPIPGFQTTHAGFWEKKTTQ